MTELRDRFDALGPWYTCFEIDGVKLGGPNSYDDDYRVKLFFDWIGQPSSILELGSLEGGDSVQLAAPSFVKRLLGLDAREANIKRAELAAELLGRANAEFAQADLDQESLGRFGRFDAVFCAGLLYHLMRPWRLLEEIAKVTDCLFLDTQYSATDDVTVEGYEGSLYIEGRPSDEGRYSDSDVLSGLSASSFWMTLPCLTETLEQLGFAIRHQRDIQDWGGYGPRIHLAAIKQ